MTLDYSSVAPIESHYRVLGGVLSPVGGSVQIVGDWTTVIASAEESHQGVYLVKSESGGWMGWNLGVSQAPGLQTSCSLYS